MLFTWYCSCSVFKYMQLLTIKSKLILQPEAEKVLLDAMFCATKVYNGIIHNLREQYEYTGEAPISMQNINKILKRLPRKDGYYSKSVQSTRDEVIGAYKSFFTLHKKDPDARPPGFRKKNKFSALQYYNGYGIHLHNDILSLSFGLSRLDGVKAISGVIQHRPDVSFSSLRSATITYDPKVGFQCHLVIVVDPPQAFGSKLASVDLGETQAMAVTVSDGQFFLYSGKWMKAIRQYWNKVRTMVKPPLPGEKKSRRYREIESKESKQIKQLLHVLSRRFVDLMHDLDVDTIVIGDLTDIRQNIQYGSKVNQRLHSWAFAKLVDLIVYKAGLYGIKVVFGNEAYTSQKCHHCGIIKKSNRKKRGLYRCECGWQVQADINGSLNIFEKQFKVSPIRSSGCVAQPVVVSVKPLRLDWHTVYEPIPAQGCL